MAGRFLAANGGQPSAEPTRTFAAYGGKCVSGSHTLKKGVTVPPPIAFSPCDMQEVSNGNDTQKSGTRFKVLLSAPRGG